MKNYSLVLLFITHALCSLAQTRSYENVVYASVTERDLLVDIHVPSGEDDPYLMLWVHGGAWHSGQKENPPTALLEKGYALASVDYRLSVEAPLPAMMHDIKACIRYLRANAHKYGYRSDKIGIFGSSAGGHLVALVGTTNGDEYFEGDLGDHTDVSSDVDVIINYFGPSNFTTILKQSTPHGLSVRAPALALLCGGPFDDASFIAKKASPVFQVDERDPPMMILHGVQDIQVPVNQSIEMNGAYQDNGLSSELIFIHGGGHGGPGFWEPKVVDRVVKFIEKAMR